VISIRAVITVDQAAEPSRGISTAFPCGGLTIEFKARTAALEDSQFVVTNFVSYLKIE